MPRWKIPVTWEVCGFVHVDADRLEDAMDYVRKDGDHIKLPSEANYVDGSFDLSMYETECIRQCYNNNQPNKEDNKSEK